MPSCQECGAVTRGEGEFHPYVFCVLKKAGRDPWADLSFVVERLGLGKLPPQPPLIRDLPEQEER